MTLIYVNIARKRKGIVQTFRKFRSFRYLLDRLSGCNHFTIIYISLELKKDCSRSDLGKLSTITNKYGGCILDQRGCGE